MQAEGVENRCFSARFTFHTEEDDDVMEKSTEQTPSEKHSTENIIGKRTDEDLCESPKRD